MKMDDHIEIGYREMQVMTIREVLNTEYKE